MQDLLCEKLRNDLILWHAPRCDRDIIFHEISLKEDLRLEHFGLKGDNKTSRGRGGEVRAEGMSFIYFLKND